MDSVRSNTASAASHVVSTGSRQEGNKTAKRGDTGTLELHHDLMKSKACAAADTLKNPVFLRFIMA
jgi:hypothetical protein